MDSSIVITDQYYENKLSCNNGKWRKGCDDLILIVDSHDIVLEASATQMTHDPPLCMCAYAYVSITGPAQK